ncbi:MAG TPA: hypothetical protein DD827_03085 [Gammaproteobacteria bacterium]|jgi:cell division protein FtsB|nr:hypothetical protein [Gammaproteobacteria bacterium]
MAKIIKPKPVVTIHGEGSSTGWLIPLILAVVMTFAVLAYLFWPDLKTLFLRQFATDYVEDSSGVEALQSKIEVLQQENDQLAKELAFAKRSSDIDKKANVALVDALTDREKKAAQTKEELGFYKNIVSDKGIGKGIEIRSFQVSKGNQATDYSYKLVLSRSGTKKKAVAGRVEIRVQGKKNGTSVMLGWSNLRVGNASTPNFKFQYFQTLEGEIRFPVEFVPENVLVKVSAAGSEQPVQQSYSWNAIVKGGEKT